MAAHPNFDLSRLPEIGWDIWDPIGLKGQARLDDEYDRYLLRSADRIWDGADAHEIARYLAEIEATAMGLGNSADARERTENAARALTEYVETLRS